MASDTKPLINPFNYPISADGRALRPYSHISGIWVIQGQTYAEAKAERAAHGVQCGISGATSGGWAPKAVR